LATWTLVLPRRAAALVFGLLYGHPSLSFQGNFERPWLLKPLPRKQGHLPISGN